LETLAEFPLMTLPGPQFLAIYALVAFLAVMATWIVGQDNAERRLPAVPARPDPYELAYLRGGAGGVVWMAIYALKRAGLVKLTDGGELRPLGGAPPAHRIEATALNVIASGCSAASLVKDRELARSIQALDGRLAAQGLVPTDATRAHIRWVALGLGLGLVALAAAKIAVATAHGHRNIGFLVIECVIAVGIIAVLVGRATGRKGNARGRAFVDRVKLAYEGRSSGSGAAASLALLAVGIYGFQVLAGGPEAAFAKQAQASGGGDGGGGGSCSSGGDGGGGCGGCGGGD
jgi:uncharacterized protein (TIGR04222 family)